MEQTSQDEIPIKLISKPSTSLKIKRDLWKRFKAYCSEKDISLVKKLEQIILKEITSQ